MGNHSRLFSLVWHLPQVVCLVMPQHQPDFSLVQYQQQAVFRLVHQHHRKHQVCLERHNLLLAHMVQFGFNSNHFENIPRKK